MSTNKKSSNNALAMTLLKGRTFIVLIVLLIFSVSRPLIS